MLNDFIRFHDYALHCECMQQHQLISVEESLNFKELIYQIVVGPSNLDYSMKIEWSKDAEINFEVRGCNVELLWVEDVIDQVEDKDNWAFDVIGEF